VCGNFYESGLEASATTSYCASLKESVYRALADSSLLVIPLK
jgi:hypothetical protein